MEVPENNTEFNLRQIMTVLYAIASCGFKYNKATDKYEFYLTPKQMRDLEQIFNLHLDDSFRDDAKKQLILWQINDLENQLAKIDKK